LGELVLTAPSHGVVLLKNFQVGELVQPGQPVVTLGNPDSMWVRVYVAAPEIGRVRLGAHVDVIATGFGRRTFPGRVVSIATSAEFTPRAALTEEERANLVFAVKIMLDPSGGALRPGLPVDVRIAPPELDDREARQ
jgi:HlyD family secretion protein